MNITNRISKKTIKLNYILAYFAVAFSGIHFFSAHTNMKVIFTILLTLIFILKGKKIDISLIFVSSLFFSVLIFQDLSFGSVSIRNYISFFMYYIITPYLLIKIIGDEALKYIIDILVLYCIISLVFWSLSNLYGGFHDFTRTLSPIVGGDSWNQQFILYTYETAKALGLIIRNPGPFNEPGSFALFLLLALIFNVIRDKGRIKIKSIIIIITILTTFSTATYLSLLLLLGLQLKQAKINILTKSLFIILFIILSYIVIVRPRFMLDKVVSQYQEQMSLSLNRKTAGRFHGTKKSIYLIGKYPLFGKGLVSATASESSYTEATGYGILYYISQLGIFVSVIYLTLLWRSISFHIKKYSGDNEFTKWAFASLIVSMFSQYFNKSPVFMMLIFIPLIFKEIKKA